jgi:HEPN domain-containing protein
MNRSEFKALSKLRLDEARSLIKSGHYSGAYYLAGYVVGFALKACIAKQTQRYDFPDKRRTQDSWTHSITTLVKTAGLQTSLDGETNGDPTFAANWSVVKGWDSQSRYGNWDEKTAQALVKAITDKDHGVLRWLRRHW